MSDYLPAELWFQIFKKSSPKTLIRCSCVCKSWRSFIFSKSFISAHIAAQKPQLIIKSDQQYYNYIPFSSDQTIPSFDIRFRSEHLGFRIIGTVNGVICLVNESLGTPNDVVLWNPSIKRCVYPPTSPHLSLAAGYNSTLGFGFDENDPKVVRVARIIRGGVFGRRVQLLPKAEVFSVREGRWRKVDYNVLDCYPVQNRWAQCYVNGSAHWSAFLRLRGEVLLSFNFKTEEFKTLELPRELQGVMAHVSKLGSTMLSMVHFKYLVGGNGAHGCEVWAMQEYGEPGSWCKMTSIDWEWGWGGVRSVIWTREDVKEMIVSTEVGEMLRYDCECREAKLIDIRCDGDGCFADGFVESLAMLGV